MSYRTEGLGQHDVMAESVAYRRLAMRVIERAFRDVAEPSCRPREQQTAREFLAGSAMLFHWCRVATLDPRRVMASAMTLDRHLAGDRRVRIVG
jgi:hypothetical protein